MSNEITSFLSESLASDGWEHVRDVIDVAITRWETSEVEAACEAVDPDLLGYFDEVVAARAYRAEQQVKQAETLAKAEEAWEHSLHKQFAEGAFPRYELTNTYVRQRGGLGGDRNYSVMHPTGVNRDTSDEVKTETLEVVQVDEDLYLVSEFLTKDEFINRFNRYSVVPSSWGKAEGKDLRPI